MFCLWKFKRMKTLRKRWKIWLAAGVVLAALAVWALWTGLVVRTYTLETAKLDQPVRLLLLTDLHSTVHGRDQRALIDLVRAQAPDAPSGWGHCRRRGAQPGDGAAAGGCGGGVPLLLCHRQPRVLGGGHGGDPGDVPALWRHRPGGDMERPHGPGPDHPDLWRG